MRHKTSGSQKWKALKMADFCGKMEYKQFVFSELANRWFQPLTHVSGAGSPRHSSKSCQRCARETRGARRRRWSHEWLQSVRPVFSTAPAGGA